MTLLKSTCLVLFMCTFFSDAYSQGFTLKIAGSEFRPGEKIVLVFETKDDLDSIGKSDLGSFTVVRGPNKSTSNSVINGKRESSYSLTYYVISMIPGEIKVTAPSIYKDGKETPGETYSVTISGNPLTEEEKENLLQKNFRLSQTKPLGTMRYVINGDNGYAESCIGSEWIFHRYLTKKEIKRIKKIKTRMEIVEMNGKKI